MEKCFANIPFQTLGSSEDTVRSNMRFLKALIQKEPCWISDPYPIKIIGSLEDQKTCRRIEPNVMSSGVGFIISV